MPNLWSLIPILALGTLPTPDLYCYMVTPANRVIDLGQLCGITETQPPAPVPSGVPAPVVGGNDLIPAVLTVQQDGGVWVVSGAVGNRGPVGITIRAVQFDLLDGAGAVVYQGSIVPREFQDRVQAGTQQRVSTRVPGSQVAGKPVSAVVTEVRYVR
jgi:hypothetical protein